MADDEVVDEPKEEVALELGSGEEFVKDGMDVVGVMCRDGVVSRVGLLIGDGW